jgi:hypothetical protein
LLLTFFSSAMVAVGYGQFFTSKGLGALGLIEAKIYSALLFVLVLVGAGLLLIYGQAWARLMAQYYQNRTKLHSAEKKRVSRRERWLIGWGVSAIALVFVVGFSIYLTPTTPPKGDCPVVTDTGGNGSAKASSTSASKCDDANEKDRQLLFSDNLEAIIWALPIVAFGFFLFCWKSYSESSSTSTAVHTIAHRSLRDVELLLRRYQGFPKIILSASNHRSADTIDLKGEADLLSARAQRIEEARQLLNNQRLQTTAAVAAGVLALLQLDPIKKFGPDPAKKGNTTEHGNPEPPPTRTSLNFRYWYNDEPVILNASEILLPVFPPTARLNQFMTDEGLSAASNAFGDSIDTMEEAYAFGARSLNHLTMSDPEVASLPYFVDPKRVDLIENIGNGLHACARHKELKIQVIGYASDAPFCDKDAPARGAATDNQCTEVEPYRRRNSDELNFALAEGRRAAVLDAMKFEKTKDGSVKSGNIVLIGEDLKPVSKLPPSVLSEKTGELAERIKALRISGVNDLKDIGFHFGAYTQFEGSKKPPAGKILPRSALIRIVSGGDGNCWYAPD